MRTREAGIVWWWSAGCAEGDRAWEGKEVVCPSAPLPVRVVEDKCAIFALGEAVCEPNTHESSTNTAVGVFSK